MKKQEIKPYLNQFITVEMSDGRIASGYVSNPDDLMNAEDGKEVLRLLNGMFSEELLLNDVIDLHVQNREDTVSIPVVDLKPGYKKEKSLLDEIEQDIDSYLEQDLAKKEVDKTDSNNESNTSKDEELDTIAKSDGFGKVMLDMKDEIQKDLFDLDEMMQIIDETEKHRN